MPEHLPKVFVNDEQPFSSRHDSVQQYFDQATQVSELPHIILASAPVNPRDRPRPPIQRVGIYTEHEERVGAFNLIQSRDRSWLNDIRIPERKGEKFGIAAYVGVIALLSTVGRNLESDPGGLSPESEFVWHSLTRRGLAIPIDDGFDQHGHARFVSKQPQSDR